MQPHKPDAADAPRPAALCALLAAQPRPRRHAAAQHRLLRHSHNFNTDRDGFFGVFDGHGESARACALRDQLQKRLALNKGAGFHTALRTAFGDTNELLHNSPIDDTMSGANAIVVVVRHGVLEIANVGDTRAILAEEESDGGEVKLVAKPLSTDQTAHRDDERARVKKCGARVLTMDQLEGLEDEGEENIRGLKRGEEIDTTGDPPRIWAEDSDYPGTVFTRSIGNSASERLGLVSDPNSSLARCRLAHASWYLPPTACSSSSRARLWWTLFHTV